MMALVVVVFVFVWLFRFVLALLFFGPPGPEKTKRKTKILDWNGNKVLNLIYKSIQNFRNLIPPIFHFTKDKVGQVTFNGMFIIDTLNEQKFSHKVVLNPTDCANYWFLVFSYFSSILNFILIWSDTEPVAYRLGLIRLLIYVT